MRPTITEQLRETRRILIGTLTPHIGDDYALQILAKTLENLEVVERCWPQVLPFLHWDNTAALALLGEVRVGADLASAIGEAASAPPCDPFDAESLQLHNAVLNALLHRAIGECMPDDRGKIRAHLLERTARYPMRPLGSADAKASPQKEP